MIDLNGEFFAAVAGALVGGSITAALQALNNRWVRNDRRSETLRQRRVLGKTLLFKVLKIESDFAHLRKHLDDCRTRAASDGLSFGWQTLRPMASLPRRVTFLAEEIEVLSSLKDEGLFNDLLALDETHETIIEFWAHYGERRTLLSDALPGKMVSATIVERKLTPEQMQEFGPRMAQLDAFVNDLDNEMIGLTRGDRAERTSRLVSALNRELNMELEIGPVA